MKKFLQILAFVPFIVAPIACGTATDDVVDVVGTDGGSTAEPETPHNIPEIRKAVDWNNLQAVPHPGSFQQAEDDDSGYAPADLEYGDLKAVTPKVSCEVLHNCDEAAEDSE